jgi:tetrahydromethanopterin S-methyltransferase subunit F
LLLALTVIGIAAIIGVVLSVVLVGVVFLVT